MGIESAFVNVKGLRTHYLHVGDRGKPVVLLHGAGMDSAALSWQSAIGLSPSLNLAGMRTQVAQIGTSLACQELASLLRLLDSHVPPPRAYTPALLEARLPGQPSRRLPARVLSGAFGENRTNFRWRRHAPGGAAGFWALNSGQRSRTLFAPVLWLAGASFYVSSFLCWS
jgi:hypothetical protein